MSRGSVVNMSSARRRRNWDEDENVSSSKRSIGERSIEERSTDDRRHRYRRNRSPSPSLGRAGRNERSRYNRTRPRDDRDWSGSRDDRDWSESKDDRDWSGSRNDRDRSRSDRDWSRSGRERVDEFGRLIRQDGAIADDRSHDERAHSRPVWLDRSNQTDRQSRSDRGNRRDRFEHVDKRDWTGPAPVDDRTEREQVDNGNQLTQVDDDSEMMQQMLGISGFGTTAGKKHAQVGAINKVKQTKYRQYMNRPGGFNRPLDSK